MDPIIQIDARKRTPKYLQIVHSVVKGIRQGHLKKGDKLFSINELSNNYLLSRVTVQKAYEVLEKEKIIQSIHGKGFYINKSEIIHTSRVLLLFNKISDYKRMIYTSFMQTLGAKALIDLKIHHSNTRLFVEMLESNLGEYDYYVVMPHFYEDQENACQAIRKIPTDQLVILDKDLPAQLSGYAAVYQDFENDIYEALQSASASLEKYRQFTLVFPTIPYYPGEIIKGFEKFCSDKRFKSRMIRQVNTGDHIRPGELFIVIEETDLVNLIKNCQTQHLVVGKDIGILSYNDTPLKEILLNGISVISTNHSLMGETAARLILDKKQEKIKNPFSFISRNSL